jgi:hypothetical protein
MFACLSTVEEDASGLSADRKCRIRSTKTHVREAAAFRMAKKKTVPGDGSPERFPP